VISAKPIKIAVMALGGQGGGVLASWLVKLGERAGYIAQSTSVPGVAQRTGATIYYVELFPKAAADEKGQPPVLALMPAPGDVDIVIAAEMMEAGRALTRGFVSDDTTLISSTHRVYAIAEKIAMGDGRQAPDTVRAAVDAAADRAIWFDMDRAAEEAGAVISAVMFGALAGSGAAPIARALFEQTIRDTGRAVEKNLAGFAQGFDAAATSAPVLTQAAKHAPAAPPPSPAVAPLVSRVNALPQGVREVAFEGVKKVVDFQDPAYGKLYLDRLEKIAALDRTAGGDAQFHELSKAAAKHLALWMAYDDVVRVADLKTRSSRFERCRDDVRAEDGQIVRVFEYMHPRVEEICDLMPSWLAGSILGSAAARRLITAALGKGRRVATTNISGFLVLNTIASLRFLRRQSFRFAVEQDRIESWLEKIAGAAPHDYKLACAIAGLQRLIKGYGDTHARGLANYEQIAAVLDRVKTGADPAATLTRLRDSALKDEEGVALRTELARLGAASPIAA
jgi:indolepyruvate ferredoxin oxidoreductase beta subunit